jgi:hypothetical protein
LAGFSLGFRFRRTLAEILGSTPVDNSIHSLDPSALKATGIAALALDFDGVLAPHGFEAPLPEAEEWLSRCVTIFGADNIFILSNKPTEARCLWFCRNFPGIRFISGVPKKPFPDGLNKIAELARLPLSAVLMVDDRLLTGCLAAINAGARPCYVRSPYVSFKQRPLIELFFMLLRIGERVCVRLLS